MTHLKQNERVKVGDAKTATVVRKAREQNFVVVQGDGDMGSNFGDHFVRQSGPNDDPVVLIPAHRLLQRVSSKIVEAFTELGAASAEASYEDSRTKQRTITAGISLGDAVPGVGIEGKAETQKEAEVSGMARKQASRNVYGSRRFVDNERELKFVHEDVFNAAERRFAAIREAAQVGANPAMIELVRQGYVGAIESKREKGTWERCLTFTSVNSVELAVNAPGSAAAEASFSTEATYSVTFTVTVEFFLVEELTVFDNVKNRFAAAYGAAFDPIYKSLEQVDKANAQLKQITQARDAQLQEASGEAQKEDKNVAASVTAFNARRLSGQQSASPFSFLASWFSGSDALQAALPAVQDVGAPRPAQSVGAATQQFEKAQAAFVKAKSAAQLASQRNDAMVWPVRLYVFGPQKSGKSSLAATLNVAIGESWDAGWWTNLGVRFAPPRDDVGGTLTEKRHISLSLGSLAWTSTIRRECVTAIPLSRQGTTSPTTRSTRWFSS